MTKSSAPSSVSQVITDMSVSRRGLIIGLGLTGGAIFSHMNMPRKIGASISQARFQSMMPDKVANWVSRRSTELVLPAEDDFQAKLYENLETRIYEGINLPSIMLLVGYSSVQENDVHVHRPEVCYPAAGFPILSTRTAAIDVGSRTVHGRELVADRDFAKERIIYWTRVGDDYPVGWAEQRWTMALSNARGITPDGLLFRASALEQDTASSRPAIEQFIKAFVAASGPSFQRSVLF